MLIRASSEMSGMRVDPDMLIQVMTPANDLQRSHAGDLAATRLGEGLGEIKVSPEDAIAVLRTFDESGNWTMAELQAKLLKRRKRQRTDPQPGLF